VNKQIPNYLRLVTDTSLQPAKTDDEDLAPLARVCQAFSEATDWHLEYAGDEAAGETSNLMWSAPVNPGVGNSPGHIRLFSPEAGPSPPRVPREQATLLAESIGQLWSELQHTRHALWQREAELAAGVPLIVREHDYCAAGPRRSAVRPRRCICLIRPRPSSSCAAVGDCRESV
jgi:hypothetical protein